MILELDKKQAEEVGRRNATQRGLAKCTAHTGIKFLKLRPYKTTVVHKLLPPERKQEYHNASGYRMRYSKDFLAVKLTFTLRSCDTL